MNPNRAPFPSNDSPRSKASAESTVLEALDSMCEYIRVDASVRRRHEQPVTLRHYLQTVPGLVRDPVLLDTAIRAVLDSEVAMGRNRAAVAADLRKANPELSEAIGLARILDKAFDSTGAFLRFSGGDFAPRLPVDFGPPWRGGEHRFSLTDRIAAGAHGVVYRAYDRALSTEGRTAWAAIKVLNAADSGAELARREAIRARVIDHPAVARVLTAGETDENNSFIAFEFVEGQPLRLWRADNPARVGSASGVQLIARIAAGLAAAHAVGVTHGDLHPGNILITASGLPKVIDFGLGHFSPGTVIGRKSRGALGFMPPECWLGGEINPVLVDVFGLGALLYWLLLGTPVNGSSSEEAERTLAEGGRSCAEIARATAARGIDHDLAWILGRALDGEQSERYGSTAALLSDLERWQHREPLLWTNPSIRRRVTLAIRRAPVTAGVCLLAAVLGIGGAAGSTGIALRGRIAVAQQAALTAESKLQVMQGESERLRQAKGISASLVKLVLQAPTDRPDPRWLLLLSLLDDLTTIEGGTASLVEKRLDRQIQLARLFAAEAGTLEGPCSMAAILWNAALGRWLLEAGRYDEASAVLEPTLSQACEFHPGDPMIERLSLMVDASNVLGAGADRVRDHAAVGAWERIRSSDTNELPAVVKSLIDARK